MNNESIERYLQAIPKAELHVHLEGSIQPTTLLILAERNGVDLPVHTVAELQNWFTYRDFNHFIDIYLDISRCLKTAEDYELIAYEFGASMSQQNVRYAEVTFSPSTHYYALGVSHDTYFAGLNRGRERARVDFGVEMRWVFDIVRNVEDETRNRLLADYTTSVAIEGKHDGVVALGLGGAEVGYPPEKFVTWFEKARDDPPLFNTTLGTEVRLLVDAFNFDLKTVNELILNGVRFSFLPVQEKQAMEA